MDPEERREKKRVTLVGDPSNKAMVLIDLLPLETLLDILSRLPITSLIHFKSTSHAGYDLVADPRLPPMFRNRAVSDSNPFLILFDYNPGVSQMLRKWTQQRYFWDSEDCSSTVRKIDPPQHSEVSNVVGSCNGLLCVSYPTIGGSSATHSLLIYNPFVRDAVRVPPANGFLDQSEDFGFGFHPRTGEFKVVRVVRYVRAIIVGERYDNVNTLIFQVFTVGTAEWRQKRDPPPNFAVGIRPPEALVEGSLLWVIVVGMGGVGRCIYGIMSFDLADEVFEEIPHPPCQRLVSRRYSLSVLNGCLSAAGLVESGHFDIWVMMQYPVQESWVRQFSFDPYIRHGSPTNASILVREPPKVICALKNGEILLQYGNNYLVSFDPVENRFKTLQISGLPHRFQALPFLPSLFSAKATMNL